MRLETVLLVGLVLGSTLVCTGAKKKKLSHSASRKCAICDWLVAHLQQRAAEEEAAGTSYEMGWRLKDDGTRVAKRVAWAQSELGFGAAVEAACVVSSDDSSDAVANAAPLQGLVQVALGDELRLRAPNNGTEAEHTLREDPLELFQSSCLEFVFEDEDALDAIRDNDQIQVFSAPKKGLSPAVRMAREVCTNRAKVCPKGRWQRWYGADAVADAQLLVPHVPRPVKTYNQRATNVDDIRDHNAGWMDYLFGRSVIGAMYRSLGPTPFIIVILILLLPQFLFLLAYFLRWLAKFIRWFKGLPPEQAPKSVDDVRAARIKKMNGSSHVVGVSKQAARKTAAVAAPSTTTARQRKKPMPQAPEVERCDRAPLRYPTAEEEQVPGLEDDAR